MNVLVNDESLKAIADAIRDKNGTETTYKPAEMAPAIKTIETGQKEFTVAQAENEVITVTSGEAIRQSGSKYILALPTIEVNVVGNSNYNAGNITVNGVDQGSNSVYALPVTSGMIISATAAIQKETNTEVIFILPVTFIHAVDSTKYVYTPDLGAGLADITGKYTLNSVDVYYDSESRNLTVSNLYSTSFSAVATVELGVDKNNKILIAKAFTPDALKAIVNQSFTLDVPNQIASDPTQPFNLTIGVTRTLQ